MKKKELEQKIAELEKRNQEHVDALIKMPMLIQQFPCHLQHYPSTPQIYTYNPLPYPYSPNYPYWVNNIQCQATTPNIEYQNWVAEHTYNLPSAQ